MSIFLLKFAITVVMVVVLSELAKRASPGIAGILVGLPLGAGLSSYFFTLERGAEFTIAAAPWGIAGLSSSIVFSMAYVMAARLIRAPGRVLPIALSSVAAICAYLAASRLLRLFNLGLFNATVITIVVMLANIAAIRKLGLPRNRGSSRPMGIALVVFRAVVAGLTVSTVTSLAGRVGAGWSGILSAFPAMLFPILLVLHFEEGDRLYPGVVEGFAYGVFNLLVFYLGIAFLLPLLGLNLSFVVLYALSALVLWTIARLRTPSRPSPAGSARK